MLSADESMSGIAKIRTGDVRRFRMRMIVESISLGDIGSWQLYLMQGGVGRMADTSRSLAAASCSPPTSTIFEVQQRTYILSQYSVSIGYCDMHTWTELLK